MQDLSNSMLLVQPVPAANSTANTYSSEVVGNKADTAVTVVAANKSIMAYLKGVLNVVNSLAGGTEIASGTFTTDSATVPADTVLGAAKVTDYYNGAILMPTAGACAYQPRKIKKFTTVTGVMELEDETPFTGVPGLVTYVIYSDTEFTGLDKIVPATPVAGSLYDILSKAAGGNTFSKATDSLEMLSDKLGVFAGTAGAAFNESIYSLLVLLSKYIADGDGDFATGTVLPANKSLYDILVDYKLGQLAATAEGAGAFPASVLDNSILAFILSKVANGDTSSFDNQTDSLEAISDKVTAVDTMINTTDKLDKLIAVDDRPAATVYPVSVVAESILNFIMSKTLDPTSFNYTTDSLEAIADSITALNNLSAANVNAEVLDVVATDYKLDKLISADDRGAALAYPDSVVAESILNFLMSKTLNPASYDYATDSLEALSDKITDNKNILDGTTTNTAAVKREAGRTQYFTKAITTATTNGTADVTVATITTQPCSIKGITLRQNGAVVAELTSLSIFGGASKVVTFIDAVSGAAANLSAEDKQVSWDGEVLLGATKTIVITIVGTGISAAQDLTVGIEYIATVDGGYLA